jgi:hypothetical protein
MHFLTSLIILAGFAFVVLIGLANIIPELSQMSLHESPVIREAPGELAAAEYAKEVESYESNPTELSDTHYLNSIAEYFSSPNVACNGRRGNRVRKVHQHIRIFESLLGKYDPIVGVQIRKERRPSHGPGGNSGNLASRYLPVATSTQGRGCVKTLIDLVF